MENKEIKMKKEIKPMTKEEIKQMAEIITTSSNAEEAVKKYLKLKNK